MRTLLGALAIACSMYSRIPMPRVDWTKERMRYALCFFPVIGVLIGTVLYGSMYVLGHFLELSQYPVLYAGFGTAFPLLVTGGIHMDGFLDVTDARSSYGDREKKLQILKDPHTGAFAIIGCGVYLLLYAACFSVLDFPKLACFAVSFVLERALSGLSVVCFPKAKQTGLAATFSGQAQTWVVAVCMVLWFLCGCACLCWLSGVGKAAVCIAVSLLVWGYYWRMSKKEFGGITGDLAGWFLQVCELALLAAAAFL